MKHWVKYYIILYSRWQRIAQGQFINHCLAFITVLQQAEHYALKMSRRWIRGNGVEEHIWVKRWLCSS